MFHARAWRRAVLLIAASLALAPMLFQPIPAAASATGTLFGITLSAPVSLSSIEPATGATTSVADLSLPPPALGPGFGISMVDDPATHRLFLLRTLPPPNNTTVQLVTVDTAHPGAAPTAINLTQPLAGLAFDKSTGTLFGLTPTNCCPNTLPIFIVKVDPTTGADNMSPIPVTGDSFGLMAVDPATHLLYVTSVTFNPLTGRTVTLLTVDTVAGAVLRSTILPIGLRGLVFDPSPSPGALFGTSFCCPAHFVKIDLATLSETTLGNWDFGMFLEGALAIDTDTHTVFTVQDVFDTPMSGPIAHIASIDDTNGSGKLGGTTGTNIPALAFEPAAAPPDTSPPTTSIALSPAPNAAGWNNANVTVNLSATDPDGVADVATVHYSAAGAQTIAPTIVAGSAASFVVNTEGVTTVTYFAKDKAGNSEAALTKVIRIDKTLPTVTHTGNAGTYTVDQTVSITCTAVDPLNANGTAASGLASTTCANVNAPAYSFPLGPNRLSASATDIAGNIGGGSSTFTVQVTSESLCTLTSQFVETSPKFLSLSLQAQKRWDRFVQRICEIFDQGEGEHGPDDKAEKVEAYKEALTHLVHKSLLTPAQAATLLSLARAQ